MESPFHHTCSPETSWFHHAGITTCIGNVGPVALGHVRRTIGAILDIRLETSGKADALVHVVRQEREPRANPRVSFTAVSARATLGPCPS